MDLDATFAEKYISIAKQESFVMGFYSVDSRTMKLGKVVFTSSMSLSVYVPEWSFLVNFCGAILHVR